ncbi:DUF3152 domain-containing protein [Streptomyces sp. NPDC014991]|uniref:DUF3152 domain-containing protein n=1 Tax=Streptomyces sp. NPDC014991 TaxID=3364935 RepID=UPI0036FBF271
MGRHSRRGPAPKGDSADIVASPGPQRNDRRDRDTDDGGDARPDDRLDPAFGDRRDAAFGDRRDAAPDGRRDAHPDGRRGDQPRLRAGTPARDASGPPDATPARGAPRSREGASTRGGHPEQREAGGGWGEFGGRPAGADGAGVLLPRQRRAGPDGPGRAPGPRQEYLEAFERHADATGDTEDDGVRAAPAGRTRRTGPRQPADEPQAEAFEAGGIVVPAQRGGNRGRTFTGIAAAAVTTVLAVVVAGQVTEGREDDSAQSPSAGRTAEENSSGAPAPSIAPDVAALSYDQKMNRTYPLGAALKGPGKFDAVPGSAEAPGAGRAYRYRVDVERGLGLDGKLFAEAVQKTLNDDRSWAHGGTRTFERVSSGKPDFVITLASPGTTATWCAKSGLDTTEDNVSCDSAATERVMINAYRWAQGSRTYGSAIHAYRQMLINHEVGHRLGHGHVTCQKNNELAPVMQQQTKFLDHDGIHCRPNPWPYPRS